MSQSKTRLQNFERWWKRNHHRKASHIWLVKNARRVTNCYYIPADKWEDVMVICKRFNNSEHRRLPEKSAWRLWCVCFPTSTDRERALIQTAKDLDEKINILKALKAEAKGYPAPRNHPLQLGLS